MHATYPDHAEQLRRLQKYLYDAIGAAIPQDSVQACKPRTFVSAGKPLADILNHIDQHEIDLLILGLHRSALLGMQYRTAAVFPIIVKAKCPVLTIASGATS